MPAFGRQLLGVLGRYGTAEEVALQLVAAATAQDIVLVVALDPLGDDLEPQSRAEGDDRPGDRCTRLVVRDVADERLVDLERADRKALEIGERRVAGAEIVDREVDAEAVQIAQPPGRIHHVLHDHTLGELELEQMRRKAGGLEGLPDTRYE